MEPPFTVIYSAFGIGILRIGYLPSSSLGNDLLRAVLDYLDDIVRTPGPGKVCG